MMQGGAVRGQRRVPKSAAYVKSVPPNERRKKRQSSSAAAQRVPIQPPVCGVQPGKVLELKTSLGILRAKELLRQQEAEQQKIEEAGDDLALLQRATSSRGQLKHGRLQPLGVVNDDVLLPTDCLGVIPVSPKTKSKQRPRSSTTPGIHFHFSNAGLPEYRFGNRRNIKRRSYSALLPRQLNTEQLLQFLSISKHTGLVPSDSEHGERLRERNLSESKTTSSSAGILPPVVRQSDLGMKIEVKRLRKNNVNKELSESKPESQNSSAESAKNTSDHGTESLPKLPQIQTSPERLQVEESNPQATLTSPPQPSEETNASPTTNGSPVKVSIVSIGETKSESPRSRVVKRKHHSPGKQSAGRLSHGWIPPQPIEPLKGNPLNTPTRNVERETDTPPEHVEADNQRPSTPGLTICVNVDEFLQDLDET